MCPVAQIQFSSSHCCFHPRVISPLFAQFLVCITHPVNPKNIPFTNSFIEPLNSLRQQIFHRMCSSCCQGKLCEFFFFFTYLSPSLSGTRQLINHEWVEVQLGAGMAWNGKDNGHMCTCTHRESTSEAAVVLRRSKEHATDFSSTVGSCSGIAFCYELLYGRH